MAACAHSVECCPSLLLSIYEASLFLIYTNMSLLSLFPSILTPWSVSGLYLRQRPSLALLYNANTLLSCLSSIYYSSDNKRHLFISSSATPTQQGFLSMFWHHLPLPTSHLPSSLCTPPTQHTASLIFHLKLQLPHHDYLPSETSIPQQEEAGMGPNLKFSPAFLHLAPSWLVSPWPGLTPPVSYFFSSWAALLNF